MYAQLGDIIFELLLGFSSYDDSRETSYAQLALINGKPKLQRTGEKLQEINISIHFNTAFCTPEAQYALLDKKRSAGEILTFVWGSGDIEGDFVITTLKKTINSLAPDGSVRDMTCDLSLLEFFTSDKIATQQKTTRQNAFAIDPTAPHPTNIEVTEPSDATAAMNDIQGVNMKSDQLADKLNVSVYAAQVKSAVIDKAQTFVDGITAQVYNIRKLLNGLNNLLGSLGIKISANPNLVAIANGLTAQLAASQNTVSNAEALVNILEALPNPVNTVSDANIVISNMTSTVNAVNDLIQQTKNLKSASAPLAAAIIARKEI